jgi:hypothetical protein
MLVRSLITYQELREAYAQIGLFPDPNEPNTFLREGETIRFFHADHNGGYYWAIVIEDIERTEEMLDMAERYSKEFMLAIWEILGPEQSDELD